MDDGEILRLFQERSEAAVKELSAKYADVCLRLAKNILGNEEDAEECVNDAFLKVWESVPPNEPRLLGAYALRITRNTAFNRIDFNNAERRRAVHVCLDELKECLPSRESVESSLEDEELRRVLREFVLGLDKQNRRIFILRYWYLETPREIAARLGASDTAVRARLARTRKKLRRFLSERDINV